MSKSIMQKRNMKALKTSLWSSMSRTLSAFGAAALLSVVPILEHQAQAQQFLRDAETEWFLQTATRPILNAAELDPGSVNFYIIGENDIQAFVTGGQNIFVFTGLITETDDVNQVLGVLAHEAGHISNAHLLRGRDSATTSTALTIASLLLGAAAIAAGAPELGFGLFGAGQTAAQRKYLTHSRERESEADQSAATFLEKSGISGRGLMEVFNKFQSYEYQVGFPQDPYIRTHPLNSDRIERLRRRVEASPFADAPPDPDLEHYYKRVKAKIHGYLLPANAVLRVYPPTDESVYARYARAYGHHRSINIKEALAEIDSLIFQFPNDPFFLELKGQLMFENGNPEDALPPLKKAVEIAPFQPLIRVLYARSMIALETKEMNDSAIKELEIAANQDRSSPFTWHQLAVAYTNANEEGLASWAAAEHSYIVRQIPRAYANARKAVELLPQGSPAWIKAQDLVLRTEADALQQRGRRRLGRRFTFQSDRSSRINPIQRQRLHLTDPRRR
ncbi:MAG: M48 family metalloprotease [Pseudomonadota bacterium]